MDWEENFQFFLMTERMQIFNYVCVLANGEIIIEQLKGDQLLECVCV